MANVQVVQVTFSDGSQPMYNVQVDDRWGSWTSHLITGDRTKAIEEAKALMISSNPIEKVIFSNGELL